MSGPNRFEKEFIIGMSKGFNSGDSHIVVARPRDPTDSRFLKMIKKISERFRCDFEIEAKANLYGFCRIVFTKTGIVK